MITFSSLGKFGRFGNQLFQVASTIGIATRNNTNFYLPKWEYQKYFKHPLPIRDIKPDCVLKERDSSYYPIDDLSSVVNYDLFGYFQSYKYFDHCEDLIRYYFEPLQGYETLGGTAIHVRRGDYLGLSHIHPNLSVDYYKHAMSCFPENTHFLVYSDDIPWCVEYLPTDKHITFGHSEDPIIDFFSMMTCENFIIAPSSFSWWAAWLSPNKNKRIIAPNIWAYNEHKSVINDRLPKTWERISINE